MIPAANLYPQASIEEALQNLRLQEEHRGKLQCWTKPESILKYTDTICSKEECINSLSTEEHPTARKIAIALQPYASGKYYPHNFFTYAEIRLIALVAERMLTRDNALYSSDFIQRKRIGIPIKLIFPAGGASILLLPKKAPKVPGQGVNKWPRPALGCSLLEGAWCVQRLWNLTSLKNYYNNYNPIFFQARAIEAKIKEAIPSRLSPTIIEDFTVLPYDQKRSCFYEYHSCLIDCFDVPGFLNNKKLVQQLALSAATKVALLHKSELALCDLKPDNMLVTEDNEVLLCDLDATSEAFSKQPWKKGGTRNYLPPEVLLGTLADNKKADVFAFGCLLFEMIFDQQLPWFIEDVERQLNTQTLASYKAFAIEARKNLEENKTVSSQIMMLWLIQWCLHPNYTERPDMQTICTYLSSNYSAEDTLSLDDIQPFLDIEASKGYCVIN